MDPESQQQPEQPRAAADAPAAGTATATESTPLLPRDHASSSSSSPPLLIQPAPVPRWVVISHWIAAIDGLVVAALCFAIIAVDEFFRPWMYYLPWGISHAVFPNILTGFVSTAWAASSLLRIRRMGVSMPPLVAVLIHALSGGWLFVAFTDGASYLMRDRPWCRGYGPVDPIRERECHEWAARFLVFLWVYLGFVFVLGIVHAALFVFTCAGPFRGVSWRESLRSWSFPTGQLTVEFTIKVLRQDRDLPPSSVPMPVPVPAPAQNQTRTVGEASASASAAEAEAS